MSQGVKQPVLLLAAIIAVGIAAWLLFRYSRSPANVDEDIELTALCTSCGHYEATSFTRLQAQAPDPRFQPALGPAFGPGWNCPKCSKATFYRNPVTCEKCSRKFLPGQDEQGRLLVKCPGCGWVREGG
jgi:DNA-directed RNA polymerase subunit RPC12/RpoP